MKNKPVFLFSLVLVMTLLLTACGSNASSSSTTETTNSSAQSATGLSQVNMLLVGSLKLEDTSQAISQDEAAQLLPLWQAYRSLSSSQTAAEAEVEALLQQIEATMSSDQIKAIRDMNLTSTDMMDLMQSMGGGAGLQGTPDPQNTPGFDFPSGGFQGGAPPSGGFQGDAGGPSGGSTGSTNRNFPQGGTIIQGGPAGDAGSGLDLSSGQTLQGTPDPSMQATAQARFNTQANQVNTLLLNVLINKLQSVTAG
jgi:hypothetical protein